MPLHHTLCGALYSNLVTGKSAEFYEPLQQITEREERVVGSHELQPYHTEVWVTWDFTPGLAFERKDTSVKLSP